MLAEGWYDPATLQKAQASVASNVDRAEPQYRRRGSPSYGPAVGIYNSSDEDLVGPTLPGGDVIARRAGKRPGPAIPNLQDLELRKGNSPIQLAVSFYLLIAPSLQSSDKKIPLYNARTSVTTAVSTANNKKSS